MPTQEDNLILSGAQNYQKLTLIQLNKRMDSPIDILLCIKITMFFCVKVFFQVSKNFYFYKGKNSKHNIRCIYLRRCNECHFWINKGLVSLVPVLDPTNIRRYFQDRTWPDSKRFGEQRFLWNHLGINTLSNWSIGNAARKPIGVPENRERMIWNLWTIFKGDGYTLQIFRHF